MKQVRYEEPVRRLHGSSSQSIMTSNASSAVAVPLSPARDTQALTGKQEHCQSPQYTSIPTEYNPNRLSLPADLKRELIAQQVKFEITELNSPTALQRFGAPFKSDFGEVSPLDSDLPILRYIFVHHVREFPFLDKAKEKEFWQDKLQVVSNLHHCVGVWGRRANWV